MSKVPVQLDHALRPSFLSLFPTQIQNRKHDLLKCLLCFCFDLVRVSHDA
jgi:hypothetical protein